MNTLKSALRILLLFVTMTVETLAFVSKRKSISFTTKFVVESDPIFDENDNLIGVKNVRVEKANLAFKKNANLTSRAFRNGTWVALGEYITALLKGVSNESRKAGIAALNKAMSTLETHYGLKLVGNRYLDGFSYDDGDKMATLLFHANGVEGFAEDLSMGLFGTKLIIKNNDSTKFMNYTWAGCQLKFGTMEANLLYAPVHAGGTDGAAVTTIEYVEKINKLLADELRATGAHMFKQQNFSMVDGHICPVKGMVTVCYSKAQWDKLGFDVDYTMAFDAIVVTSNEVKLAPESIAYGKMYASKFALISHSGEETLRKGFWRSNAQLLARSNWSDASRGTKKAYRNAIEKLDSIQTLDGYLKAVFHLQSSDVEDDTWSAVKMSAMTIAGQVVAGLPFAAFEMTKDGEPIALRELKKALKGMICSLPRLKVAGSYFFPFVDDRMVSTWEVGIGSDFAKVLSDRWHTCIQNGTLLMVQRSPHIGSGYLTVRVKLINELGAFDAIVLSKECANFLAADCDGDRVSLSLPMLGDVINPTQFPKIEDAVQFIKKAKLPETGNVVSDRLLAATLGKMIGLVDWLMTKLHEEQGSLTDTVLAFGGYVSQEVISASKHIGEDVIDLEAVSEIINPLRSYLDKRSGETKFYRENISHFYRFVTGKVEDYSSFTDKKGEVPMLPVAYEKTPLKGIYDALVEKGVNPFWNGFDWKADQAEWVRMVKNAQQIVMACKPNGEFHVAATSKMVDETVVGNKGKLFVNPAFFMSKAKIPVLHAAVALLGKTAKNAEEARKVLREHFDDKVKVLGDEYTRYLVGFWARVFATGTPERALMMALNTAEFALVVRAIKTWTPETGFDWAAIADWCKLHMPKIEEEDTEVTVE